jgi:hypothetical protein
MDIFMDRKQAHPCSVMFGIFEIRGKIFNRSLAEILNLTKKMKGKNFDAIP